MSNQVTNYQCPACTGPLHFSGETGKLQCDYCGSSYEVAEIEALYAEKEQAAAQTQQEAEKKQTESPASGGWDTSGLTDNWGKEGEGMKAYSCPSCGAELICDATTMATSCPYCGNQTVVPGQFSGTLKPDYILPFQLDKNAAVAALKAHYQGKPFLPKSFTRENHIQEITGIYVPFWMFDGQAEGDATYEATRSHTFQMGSEEVTETEHFHIYRAGNLDFEKVPVDASGKMPDDHMDSIEPFDYSALKPFSSAYLPGFLADKYDVTVEESRKRADARCQETLESALRNTVDGYHTCVMTRSNVMLRRGKVHYALLPVWTLNTKWNGKNFLFAMNGQTGKLVGDLPVSWGRFWGRFAVIAVPVAAVVTAILSLL